MTTTATTPIPRLLWTWPEVAEALSTSVSTVKLLYRSGQLLGHKQGRQVVFRPADVQAYVDRLGTRRQARVAWHWDDFSDDGPPKGQRHTTRRKEARHVGRNVGADLTG